MHRTIFFTFVLFMVSNHVCDTLGDANFTGIVSALLASRNRIPNSVFPWDLFLCVMCMHNRIAASRGCSKCRGYCSFRSSHEGLSFDFAVSESSESKPRFSEAGLTDSKLTFSRFFLRAQQGSVIYNSWFVTMNLVHESFFTTTCQNPYGAP